MDEFNENIELVISDDSVNKMLFTSNDFLNDPNNFYIEYLNKARMYFKNKYKSDPSVFIKYRSIVNKIVKFTDYLTDEDDVLSKYMIILNLINYCCLDDKNISRNKGQYIDGYDYYGLDAILGNSCCRHRASLIQDVLKYRTNIIRLGIGKDEFDKATHCILSVYNDEVKKNILLDPIKPKVYYLCDDLKIEELSKRILYIKANYSNTYFSDFDNIKSFIDYFKGLNNSKLSKEEYLYICNQINIKNNLFPLIYQDDYIEFSEILKKDRQEISMILKR